MADIIGNIDINAIIAIIDSTYMIDIRVNIYRVLATLVLLLLLILLKTYTLFICVI